MLATEPEAQPGPGKPSGRSQADAIEALAMALLERDRYTGEHSEAVIEMSGAVARNLGCSAPEVERVKSAALLHDIGKVAIPDEILHKPGPLSDQEWILMKEPPHPASARRPLPHLFYYRTVKLYRHTVRRLPAVALVAIGCLGLFASSSPAAPVQDPALAAPVVLAGPSADIVGLSGLSVARDGTGGLVFLETAGGVGHVFVSRLQGGAFGAPEQIDASLPAPSTQPVIAAGDGGRLLIAFINGGRLFAVGLGGGSSPPSAPGRPPPAPVELFDGASNPSLALSDFGKGYLAFTAVGAGGHDVRSAYFHAGRWAVESAPLDAVPGDDAGTGTGRPAVAAAGDGVGIVVWGEGGHIYSRRVSGISPSVAYEQADVPSLSGATEVSTGQPEVAVGGDSSYADVAFDEVLSGGSTPQSRVLLNRLRGSRYDGVTQPDGLSTPGAFGSDEPQVALTEYGRGLVTSARQNSHELFATLLGANGASGALQRVDSLENQGAPHAVPAIAGLYSYLVAWQQSPGSSGTPEIRARYFARSSFGAESVLSSPSRGPTDAARGLFAGGDIEGDAAIAWVQGTGRSTQIVASTLYRPPGGFAPERSFQYARTAHPVLAWTPAREPFGPIGYIVSVDGTVIGGTTATSLAVPGLLSDGPHPWQVTAVNRAGLTSTARAATVWVDTVAPAASFTLTGSARAGSRIEVHIRDTDAPAPEIPAHASGIAAVRVNWGDGSSYRLPDGRFHVYRHAGRYRVTVTVADRAGNVTTVRRLLVIAPARHRRGHAKRRGHRGG